MTEKKTRRPVKEIIREKAFWVALGKGLILMTPVFAFGKMLGVFQQQGDYGHMALCILGAGCLLGVYSYVWPMVARGRQRQ